MRIIATKDSPSPTGRSLVPVDGPGAARGAGVHHARPAATFLAHLVAIAQDAPQTRLRRRTSAGHAAAAYATAERIVPPSVVSISM